MKIQTNGWAAFERPDSYCSSVPYCWGLIFSLRGSVIELIYKWNANFEAKLRKLYRKSKNNVLQSVQLIYQLIMLAYLFELEAIRPIFINNLECHHCLLITNILAHFLEHYLKLNVIKVSFLVFIKIMKHFFEGKIIFYYDLMKLDKDFSQSLCGSCFKVSYFCLSLFLCSLLF